MDLGCDRQHTELQPERVRLIGVGPSEETLELAYENWPESGHDILNLCRISGDRALRHGAGHVTLEFPN